MAENSIVLQDKMDLSKIDGYTVRDVSALLSRMPATICHYADEVIRCKQELDEANHSMKLTRAKYQLQASANKEALGLSSVDDRKAWVELQPEVDEAEARIIKATAALAVANSKLDRADNEFITARKLASMIEKRYDAQERADKYANPYGDDAGLDIE